MTKEWIQEKIKEAHENAIEHGFYDCPECDGSGDLLIECGPFGCGVCNGTGKDPNKNIGELLMLIVSELGEALDAHRCGNIYPNADIEELDISEWDDASYTRWYEKHVKDYFPDEIADVFIRLFDLCAYIRFDPNPIEPEKCLIPSQIDNVGELLLFATEHISSIKKDDYVPLVFVFNLLFRLCEKWNIPIQKHIEAKMAYNKTRPYKHNKAY